MKLFGYDFTPHQPYLEKNTSYTNYQPAPGEPFYGQIWEVYQVDGFDKNKSIAFPDICADLMFFYTEDRVFSFFVSGTSGCRSMAEDFAFLDETATIFGVKFIPGTLQNYFVGPVSDNGEKILLASEVMHGGAETVQRMERAGTFEERRDIIRTYLSTCLAKGDRADALIVYAAHNIIENRGNLKVRDLEDKTGYSNRYLRKKFSEVTGISLKKFCAIIQLQWAYELYHKSDGNMRLVDLAAAAAYYDQSHMNYTFKTLTGMLPRTALNLYAA